MFLMWKRDAHSSQIQNRRGGYFAKRRLEMLPLGRNGQRNIGAVELRGGERRIVQQR